MNWTVIQEASLVIQIHLAAAMLALVLGTLMWIRPKGTASHKFIGRSFIGLMVVTAITAIFIKNINQGQLSWIHIFVPVTLIAAFQAVYFIRKKDVRRHKRVVAGLFFGALLIPGIFTLMPGRLLHAAIFGG
ncbi:DUF2306 domain-containing protein [Litorimonas sp. RW-G-Af-16]|uniref:DUF2306 domain-containing protein n=1 Tax=Litorimonas sp. RW-G-Af-16 TaxID=3241168 RepID=UPI00390C96F4